MEKAVEGINTIIKQILNGYDLEEILPKQKIYGYKCFVLMGACYYELGSYDLAMRCYFTAERLAESETQFYSVLKKENCFEENFKACIPLRPLYYKIIDCASKGNDKSIIDEYFEKL